MLGWGVVSMEIILFVFRNRACPCVNAVMVLRSLILKLYLTERVECNKAVMVCCDYLDDQVWHLSALAQNFCIERNTFVLGVFLSKKFTCLLLIVPFQAIHLVSMQNLRFWICVKLFR
jgi:hypothetical protein